jgi:hypothetical protein
MYYLYINKLKEEQIMSEKIYSAGEIVTIKKEWCDAIEEETMEYVVIEDRDTRVLIADSKDKSILRPTQSVFKYMLN